MTTLGVSEKKERSMAELIIVIVLFAIMMKIFIGTFFAQEQNIKEVGFNAIAANFNSQVTAIHAQWIIDGHPTLVILSLLNDSRKQVIKVNKFGWVDSYKKALVCEDIWQQVMEMPLEFMKSAISAIEIKNQVMQQGHLCRFSIESGQYFEYRTDNGYVSIEKSKK